MAPKHPLDVKGSPTGGPAKKLKPDDDGDVEMAEAEYELPSAGLFDPLTDIEGFAPFAGIVEGDTEFSTDPPTSTDPHFPTDPVDFKEESDSAIMLEDLDYTSLPSELLFVDQPEDKRVEQSGPRLSSSPPTAGGASEVVSKGRSFFAGVAKRGEMELEKLKQFIPYFYEKAPERERLKAKFKRVDNLDNEKNGNAKEGWIGVNEALGEGGQGCARLFVKLDEEGVIIDQIAVKETYESAATWLNFDFWHENREGKDPREAIIHLMLTLRTPQKWERCIIGYMGHSVNHKNKSHRTYMEYVDGGDLYNLFKAQDRPYTHKHVDPEMGEESLLPTGAQAVPEAFIWYFLKQMVTAIHRMNNIPLRSSQGTFVVHQDIKPANIFLGRCDPNEFPIYPIMKLGDFGSARITAEADPHNPRHFHDPITPGYIAPEMSPEIQKMMPMWKLGSATNIWQIATTAGQMMTGILPPVENYDRNEDLDDRKRPLVGLEFDYSENLIDILNQMLDPDPACRPDCQDILTCYYENKLEWEQMADPDVGQDFDTWSQWLHWREGDGKWGIDTVFSNPKRWDDYEGTDNGDDGSGSGGGGGGGGGDEYDGPKSTIKGPRKPPPAEKAPRKKPPQSGPKKPPAAEKQPRKKPPQSGPSKPPAAEKQPRKKHVEKAPRKRPVAGTFGGDDNPDTTKKRPMRVSEAAKMAKKRLPGGGPAKPAAGKKPPFQTGIGVGKRPPEKGPPPGTGKGPPPGTGKGPPPGTGKHPPPGTGKHPPGALAPVEEAEDTGDETEKGTGDEEEETEDEAGAGEGEEEEGGEEGDEEAEAYEYEDEDEYAYEKMDVSKSTSGSKYEPSTSDTEMEDY